MPIDWTLHVVLVVLALLAGYAIGIARGRKLGHKAGRRAAWEEYGRATGLPPTEPEPGEPYHKGPPFTEDSEMHG